MTVEELLKKYEAGERSFPATNLSEANLSRTNLSQIDLSQSILIVTNLSGANLTEADLSNTRFNVARLSGANLTKANLSGAVINVANLILANLSEANMTRAELIRAELIRAELSSANLTEANLNAADLREAKLRQANLTRANLKEADLRGTSLIGAVLEQANLNGTNLSRANLTGADLTDIEMRHANLNGANLSGACLRGANLRWADLRGANLKWADLSDTKLSGANLMGADLENAVLSNASLVHADLTQANLIQVEWEGADISGAILTGTKLYDSLRFELKTEGVTCEWVDLSPTGDRSQVYRFTGEQAQKFFNQKQPSVQAIVDGPLDGEANFLLAKAYLQIARQYVEMKYPPSIEVGQRRTTLTFKVERDEDLFPMAGVAVLPFKGAKKARKNLVQTIKRIQSQQFLESSVSVREANRLAKMGVAIAQKLRKAGEVELQPPEGTKGTQFFRYPARISLNNSSGQEFIIHQDDNFGRPESLPAPSGSSAPSLQKKPFSLPSEDATLTFICGFTSF